MPECNGTLKNIFFPQIFLIFLLNSATCRTAKKFREMPDTARLSQADYPQYNIIAPNGKK